MNAQIAGTTALVTGANRGIGHALVQALLDRGARKVYAAARRPEQLEALARTSGGRVVPIALDVTNSAQIRAAAQLAPDVTLLINNAGIVAQLGGDFADAGWIAAARDEFGVNVIGTLEVTQAFAPILQANGGGAVANISSVAGLVALPILTSYSASKAALHSITQATRAQLAPQGTFVAGVYPGPIDTDMSEKIPFEKASPESAAHAILDGLEAGEEEIFPDPMSRQLGEIYLKSPKALEQQMSAAPSAA